MPGPAERLDGLPEAEAREALRACCASSEWVARMLRSRPFRTDDALMRAAETVWRDLAPDDWLEAFSAHPPIGAGRSGADADPEAATTRHGSAAVALPEVDPATWSEQEQAGTRAAVPAVLAELEAANATYEKRFGHVFLICATGRSAEEMLQALHLRLSNDPETELRIAADEQARITHLRLRKLARK